MAPPPELRETLERLLRDHPSGQVELGALADAIEPKAVHSLLIALGIMTLIPLICTPAGLLCTLLFLKVRHPTRAFPPWLGRRKIPLARIARTLEKISRFAQIIARPIPPFCTFAMRGHWAQLHYLYGAMLALLTVVFIPGINYLFGPALLLLTLAIATRNGILCLCAYLLPAVELIFLGQWIAPYFRSLLT